MEIAEPANHVLSATHFEHPTTDFVRTVTDTVDHHRERNVVGAKFVRVQIHLVLANESPNGSDFRNTRDGLQLVSEIPILKTAQVSKAVLVGAVNDRILVHPARSRRVGANHRRYVFRQDSLELLDVFKDARTSPIKVGAVFEDYEDVGVSKHGLGSDGLHMGGGKQRGYDRIGDLV